MKKIKTMKSIRDKEYVSLSDLSWIDKTYYNRLKNKKTYKSARKSIIKKICARYGDDSLYDFINFKLGYESYENFLYHNYLYEYIFIFKTLKWINRLEPFIEYLERWTEGPFYILEHDLSFIDELNHEFQSLNTRASKILDDLYNVKSFNELFSIYEDHYKLLATVCKYEDMGYTGITMNNLDKFKIKEKNPDYIKLRISILEKIAKSLSKQVTPGNMHKLLVKYGDQDLAACLFENGEMKVSDFLNSKYYDHELYNKFMYTHFNIFKRILKDNNWEVIADSEDIFYKLKDKYYDQDDDPENDYFIFNFKDIKYEDVMEAQNEILLEKVL